MTLLEPLLELLNGQIVLLDTVNIPAWTVPALIVVTVVAVRGVRHRHTSPEPDDSDPGTTDVTLIPATTYDPNDHTIVDYEARLYASGWPLRIRVDTSPDWPDPAERGSVRTQAMGQGVHEALNTLTDVHVIPDSG